MRLLGGTFSEVSGRFRGDSIGTGADIAVGLTTHFGIPEFADQGKETSPCFSVIRAVVPYGCDRATAQTPAVTVLEKLAEALTELSSRFADPVGRKCMFISVKGM